jgi:hypothetical protein
MKGLQFEKEEMPKFSLLRLMWVKGGMPLRIKRKLIYGKEDANFNLVLFVLLRVNSAPKIFFYWARPGHLLR